MTDWDDGSVTHRFAQLRDVRLHYVERGGGPLVVLLHGFPEFWYSWRHQFAALADAGFRVVAPDMRGYNLSDKPPDVGSYRVEHLAADIAQLIAALGEDSATVVGHDWGGLVAWYVGMWHPERVERLVALNAPHPDHFLAMAGSAEQLRKSWYIALYQVPGLGERGIARKGFAVLRSVLRRDTEREGANSEADVDRYVEALSQGGPRAPMNYYRALVRRNPFALRRKQRPIEVPVQVIWGARDRHVGIEFAEPPAKWVWDVRVDLVEDAGHWVQVDRPQTVNRLLLEFLAEQRRARTV